MQFLTTSNQVSNRVFETAKLATFDSKTACFDNFVARTVILEIDCDDEVEFFHVYQGLQDAIDAVEGPENKKLARFPLVKDSMIPMQGLEKSVARPWY